MLRVGFAVPSRLGSGVLSLDHSSYLDDSCGKELIYADPGRELKFLASDALGPACPGLSVAFHDCPVTPENLASPSGLLDKVR